MTTEPLAHNPQASQQYATGSPTLNKVLSVAYAGGTPDVLSYTEQTFFDIPIQSSAIAVSIVAETAGGVPTPANDFVVGLYRSLDYGHTWQLFKTYTQDTEEFLSIGTTRARWQFRLTTKGANVVRVRAA